MIDDEILQEIRATREAFAAAHGSDIRAMGEALKKFDLSGRTVVNLEVPSEPSTKSTVETRTPSAA
jgi:hypothetical protein